MDWRKLLLHEQIILQKPPGLRPLNRFLLQNSGFKLVLPE